MFASSVPSHPSPMLLGRPPPTPPSDALTTTVLAVPGSPTAAQETARRDLDAAKLEEAADANRAMGEALARKKAAADANSTAEAVILPPAEAAAAAAPITVACVGDSITAG